MGRCQMTLQFPRGQRRIFKDWVMKNMAISFHMFKKNLKKDYIKKGRVPDFEKHFKKQCPFWDAFVQYKLSETSEKRTAQAKENVSKKKHFHHLGQGVIRRRSPNGKKWKTTSLKGESYRHLSTGRSEQSISSMLMEAP